MNKPPPPPDHTHTHTHTAYTHREAMLRELLLVQNSMTDQCLIPKSREKVIFCLTGIPLTIPPISKTLPYPFKPNKSTPKQHTHTHTSPN